MAGEGDKSSAVFRRRLTTSIKRVMSYTSEGSTGSQDGTSSPRYAHQRHTSETVAPKPKPVEVRPKPVEVRPRPVEVKPKPVEVKPKPVEARPKPVEVRVKPIRPPKVPTTPPPVLNATERAQLLFKKHGLDVRPSDLPACSNPHPERIQKDIRMRIHRTCHKCDTPYGPDKTCLECGHLRCKKCPRHPAKKHKGHEKPEEPKRDVTKAPGYKKRPGDVVYGITIRGRRGGQDLVHKEVRQRVHRTCHRCQSDFGAEKVCDKCGHNRCKKCPRNPKSRKPILDESDSEIELYGPPRRTYRKPRRRIHWTCSRCDTTFIEKTRICGGCGANRDNTGVRDPPLKPKTKGYQPTDVDVKRLNQRLKATKLSA